MAALRRSSSLAARCGALTVLLLAAGYASSAAFAVLSTPSGSARRGFGEARFGRGRPDAAPARTSRAALAVPAGLVSAKAAVSSLWLRSGLGAILLAGWAKLAPFPPFSWMQTVAGWITGAPTFYKYYMAYYFGSMILKKIIPGLYAQLTTGTWLEILKAVNIKMYNEEVSKRLVDLLQKQAKLKAAPGRKAAELSPAVLEALRAQAKEDANLLDVLGSASALELWHKLEKTPIDDPALFASTKPNTQARWMIEALKAGYLGDIESAAKRSAFEVATGTASQKLQALSEAVRTARFSARHGLFGTGAASHLAAVERASGEASKAVADLEVARKDVEENGIGDRNDAKEWDLKLQELMASHAKTPAVSEELSKLIGLSKAVATD